MGRGGGNPPRSQGYPSPVPLTSCATPLNSSSTPHTPGHSFLEPEGKLDRGRARFDAQTKYAVPMASFWDLPVLKAALQGWVQVGAMGGADLAVLRAAAECRAAQWAWEAAVWARTQVGAQRVGAAGSGAGRVTLPPPSLPALQVVDELPGYLDSPLTSVYEPASGVDPQRPTTLAYYHARLQGCRVLRLRCPLLTVSWRNEVGGWWCSGAICCLPFRLRARPPACMHACPPACPPPAHLAPLALPLPPSLSMQRLGQLRKLLVGSLRPSQQIQALVEQQAARLAAAAAAAGPGVLPEPQALQQQQPGRQQQEEEQTAQQQEGEVVQQAPQQRRHLAQQQQEEAGEPLASYLGLHLRNEEDWWEYCAKEVKRKATSWVASFNSCYVPPDRVAATLGALGLPARYATVYVASGNLTAAGAGALLAVGFRSVVSQELRCTAAGGAAGAPPACDAATPVASDREVRAAVDYRLLLSADFFVGNVFSSFSGSIRAARLVRRDPTLALADAIYINAPLNVTAGDLAPIEAVRFGVYPAVLHPQLYTDRALEYAWLLSRFAEGRCLNKLASPEDTCHNRTAPPEIKGLTLLSASRSESYVTVSGWVNLTSPGWWPQLEVYLNGTLAGTVLANQLGRNDSAASALFQGQVPFQVPTKRPPNVVNVTVCALPALGAVGGRVCTAARKKVDLRPPLATTAAPGAAAVVYFHYPFPEVQTGGPEALHQLHREINRWHEAGEIAVRSVFPKGSQYYFSR